MACEAGGLAVYQMMQIVWLLNVAEKMIRKEGK